MLVVIAQFGMLGALLLPFLRIGHAQPPPLPSTASPKLVKCYQCTATRPTYKNPSATTTQLPTLPTSSPGTNNSSSSDTTLSTNWTTTTTGASSTYTPILADESDKSRLDDPCWDTFSGQANGVPQVDCPPGRTQCYKRVIRNSPNGDEIIRGCSDYTYHLAVELTSPSYCSDNATTGSYPHHSPSWLMFAHLTAVTTGQKSAGITDISCYCNTDLCNTATVPYSLWTAVISILIPTMLTVLHRTV